MGHFARNSSHATSADIIYKDLDTKHKEEQKYGILAISNAAKKFLNPENLFETKTKFDSMQLFLSAGSEGWVKVADDKMEIGDHHSPWINITIYLYR